MALQEDNENTKKWTSKPQRSLTQKDASPQKQTYDFCERMRQEVMENHQRIRHIE